jgi:hypothetical protein
MLSLACVFLRDGPLSVEMWLDHGEDRCCDLSKVVMVETVGSHQMMWIVMLESTKDWILGVDTPGQHVPPRAWYGMASSLIRKALVSLSYRERRTGMAIPTRPQGARGAWGYTVVPNRGILSNCERGLRVYCGTQQGETYGKARHTIWG